MSTELNEEQIQHILQGIKIPPQPQILVDIQMEQVMPDPDISRIAQLISQDVGLAGTVLKFVNSPMFGLSNKIASIAQAVSLLGLKSVVNIINGISIKGEMSDEHIVELTRFWDTANDISSISANIAKKIGYQSPDEAYMLGLFHNCGIPLMIQRFPNYLQVVEEAYSQVEKRITETENERLNTNHAVVGYYTAKSWNLPKHICEAIAEHHSAERIFGERESRNPEKKTLLAVLKISEHICGNFHVLGRQSEDHEWNRIQKDVLEFVGLTNYDVDEMKESFSEMGVSVSNYR
ncbi:predicted signal transduction protein [Hahella chejuensis KCTC 2396]|uniref:Predicted signal transduction protein n=1 Tax=Hahella chejuensis (strain KCTC 2396) TaxID=349521 RepID=Q2S9N5_HAHCH|nr:HDOD domain-containing protein [Hahella chejuensis]ABC32639.1 predicted signal transduction protein [Hahella chejuensis KCTC 2396]